MKQITNSYTKEIIELHKRIEVYLNKSLKDAIRIGELLTLKKSELKHGEYGEWIVDNLPFTDRTARNYVKLYSNRKLLKTETVSDLKGAYKLLSGKYIDPSEHKEPHQPEYDETLKTDHQCPQCGYEW
jgi:hypothetical protein|tara:strand:- start:120 stop:503 length:384 start_codon:yes stop_codon:yes gene_type:complete